MGANQQEELEIRRKQLQAHLRSREQAVAEEIRTAALSMEADAKLAAFARERTRSWDAKVKDVGARVAQGLGSFAEVTSARLDWLNARADVIRYVIAWNVDFVKLKQGQGILGLECHGNVWSPVCAPPQSPEKAPDSASLPLKKDLEQLLLEGRTTLHSGLEVPLP
jgi:hypothetical protein